MTDLVQNIADAVLPFSYCDPQDVHSVRAKIVAAIRQTLADAGEPVAHVSVGREVVHIIPVQRDARLSNLRDGQKLYTAHTDSGRVAHVGDSKFESWFSTYDPACNGSKQQARDAYAAGMNDPDSGRVAELEAHIEVIQQIADNRRDMLAATEQQLTESQEREVKKWEAIGHYEDALLAECPEGATGWTFVSWNRARAALAAEQGKNDE